MAVGDGCREQRSTAWERPEGTLGKYQKVLYHDRDMDHTGIFICQNCSAKIYYFNACKINLKKEKKK